MASEGGHFEESLKKITFVCKIGGLDLENRKNNYKQKIVFLINFFWLNSDLVGAACNIIFGLMNGKDFIELTYGAPCVTFSFLANFKSLTIIFNAEKLFNLFTVLKNLEKKNIEKEESVAREKIVLDEKNFLHGLIKALNVSYVLLVVAFAVNPVSVTIYKYFLNNEVDLRLPFFIMYPFDAFDIRYWPSVYLHQVWSEIVVIVWVSAVDYIFYVCCTYIRIQFRLLEHDLEKVITVDTNKEDFQDKFRELVLWHQELINCTHVLEEIYAKSTLYNFISSSILICLTGFDVLMISDSILVMSFVSFLSANLFQIFFLCFFGDLLMRSSVDISNGAYKSLWYSKDASFGKSLLLIQIRSQKPCKLTAYDFADVNLTAFTRILSNAWSYFALLNTIYG